MLDSELMIGDTRKFAQVSLGLVGNGLLLWLVEQPLLVVRFVVPSGLSSTREMA